MDFLAGCCSKVEATGAKDFGGVQAQVGEVLACAILFWRADRRDWRRPDAVTEG